MEKHYKTIFFAIIFIKLLLAWFVPLTSDESYYLTWGEHLQIDYYDHPPITGWFVYLLSILGNHVFFQRLFAIFAGIVVAGGIYLIINHIYRDKDKAALISLVFLVSPLNLLFIMVTSDAPLFLFVFLSGISFFYGIRLNNKAVLLLAGIFLGFAVLSKYFSGLLLIAYAEYVISRKKGKALLNGIIVVIGALPLVFLHLYGEYQSCWTNVMFNVFNRNAGSSINPLKVIEFFVLQIYLATPWVLYYLVKNLKAVKEEVKRDNNLFAYLFLTPMAVFFIVSFLDTGLHWTLSFYPFLFFLLVYLDKTHIKKIIWFSGIFSIVHLLIIAVLLSLPDKVFQKHEYYRDLVMYKYGDEIYDAIKEKYGDQYFLATDAYTLSGAMEYHSDERFIVFLSYSRHGRNDDKLTDFKALDGKNILILSTVEMRRNYSIYFEKTTKEILTIRDNPFYIVRGDNFRFEKYREVFLTDILNLYYKIPSFLPVGECYFYDYYFPDKQRQFR